MAINYAQFTKSRQEFWDSFANRVRTAATAPKTLDFAALEQLAIDYRRILQDHAQARASFPESAAAKRLGRLAIESTHFLFADDAGERFTLRYFFGTLFPRSMRAHARHMGLCLALFVCSIVMAFSASTIQPAIGTRILGPETIERLQQGELWTERITRTVPSSISSSAIATNNMSVGIVAWAGGALFGAGAIYIVITNGFLLGAVFGTTANFGMAHELLEFISAHGPLELSLILVCSGHGLAMGHALLEPHDRSRQKAIGAAARQALIGLVGSLPWFLLLGIVEAFVSPSDAVTIEMKLSLGAVLLCAYLLVAFRPIPAKEIS